MRASDTFVTAVRPSNLTTSLLVLSHITSSSEFLSPYSPSQTPHQYTSFLLHSSLDLLSVAHTTSSSSPYYKGLDKMGNLTVSAYVTPSSCKFLLLHPTTMMVDPEKFFMDVLQLWVKTCLNTFGGKGEMIRSKGFDEGVRKAARKYLT